MSLLLAVVANVGTLARTNNNDTSTAAGSPVVTGTLARTNANDTSAASGSPGVAGTLATTNNNDTVVASGTVVAVVETGGGTVTHAGYYQPAKPRPKPEPPKPNVIILPTIFGHLYAFNLDDYSHADGAVDPHRLLEEDDELLLYLS